MTTRIKKRQGGYYTVEAAVFLPLFILAIFTLAFLMTVYATKASVLHSSVDEAHKLSLTSYTLKTDLQLRHDLPQRIREECDAVDRVNLRRLFYLYSDGREEDLISFTVDCRMHLPLPFALGEEIPVKTTVRCRAWTGRPPRQEPLGFAAMEGDGVSETVYVFPQSGTHYHGPGCTFVSNTPVRMVLTDEVEKDYRPCGHCGAGSAVKGALVYCYPSTGEVYHTDGCRYVDKYVIPMERQEAEAEGYLPCGACGGK